MSGCTKQPDWQVVSSADGQLMRMHNQTGEVQFYYKGEWLTYEQARTKPRG